MICTRCLTRLSRRTPTTTAAAAALTPASRTFTTTPPTLSTPVTTETTTTSTPRSATGAPVATSKPGVAQPFSSPLTPAAKPAAASAPKRIPSSVAAGTPLTGLNFIKGQNDPVALADDEYPAWLWRVLDKTTAGAGGAGAKGAEVDEGDLYAKSKKQRQRAAKILRKRAAQNPESLVPKVPVYEQSVDLPGGDGSLQGSVEAGEARGALTKAMRDRRRKLIKEDNFLRAMG